MYDRPHLNGTFRRGSRLDSFLDSSKRDQNRKFNQGNIVSASHVERQVSSIEHEARTRERLRRLSMSIRFGCQGLKGNSETPQSKIQIEQILLYINTGAKYNNNIYQNKEEYAHMVLDIFSVGGHCSDVMISSFKNIVSNHKVNNVSMTRMDRLLNFLSLVQDLHKNYCDPTITGIAPRRRFQREIVTHDSRDFRSKSLPCINSIYKSLNENASTNIEKSPKDILPQKTSDNTYLKRSILDKYKFRKDNRDLYTAEKLQSARDIIIRRCIGELRKTPSPNIKLPTRELNMPSSDEASVRKVFEFLQRSRKKFGDDKCTERPSPKLMGQKGFVIENKDSRDKSERFMKLEEVSLKFKRQEDQRIQGLRRLIDQLKDIKLGSHVRETKITEGPRSSSVSLPDLVEVPRKTNERYSKSTFNSLEPDDLIQTQKEFLDVLNKNIGHEKYFLEKVGNKNNFKESVCKEKKRWELDTPYIDYRKIGLHTNSSKYNMNEYCKEQINTDYYGNTRKEPKFIPGMPPVSYLYSETKELISVTQRNTQKLDLEADSQRCQESIESHANSEHSPMLPEIINRNNQLDNSSAHESVSLSSEQTLKPESIIPEDGLSTKDVQAEIKIPTDIRSPKNTYINEALETSNKEEKCNIPILDLIEPVNTDLTEFENTPIHKTFINISSSGEVENNPENMYDLENSPLDPIKILRNGEVVEEISEISNKLENVTLLNESLIKKIEDLPIKNINFSNDDLSILKSYIENSERSSPVNENAIAMDDRISNIEYFTSGDEELRSKIEEYNYWFESASSGNYYELGLDGLNLDEFYYKNMESIPKCYDELIDMSVRSVYNICKIICDKLPRAIMEHITKDAGRGEADLGIESLIHHELCEEDLMSFVHEQVMKDPNYLGFKSSVRRDIYPPDDNFILLIIDLIKELVQKWRDDAFSSWKAPITHDLISKQVVDILCNSYEPYLSEMNSEEWILKKIFHAPRYPNILESEKELLNIEHFFKYHSCEDSITNEYIGMDRQQWLQTSNYYLPLLNEVVEQILHEIIDNAILGLKAHN